jgi:Fe2+ or Zn2+ uptake regulation protein
LSKITKQLDQAFKTASLRPTVQRYAVLEFLASHHAHATADEIFHAVNRRDPRASRATVYNNLHSLANAGLVREVLGEGQAARFDANLQPHHHFVCASCGLMEDIPWFDLSPEAGTSPLGKREVHSYEVVFRGTCVRCRVPRPKRGVRE